MSVSRLETEGAGATRGSVESDTLPRRGGHCLSRIYSRVGGDN